MFLSRTYYPKDPSTSNVTIRPESFMALLLGYTSVIYIMTIGIPEVLSRHCFISVSENNYSNIAMGFLDRKWLPMIRAEVTMTRGWRFQCVGGATSIVIGRCGSLVECGVWWVGWHLFAKYERGLSARTRTGPGMKRMW